MSDTRSAGPDPIRAAPALRLRNLSVRFGAADTSSVVHGVSLEVAAGECLAIVGESGSGKSVTARSLLGLAGAGAVVTADEITLAGDSVLGLSESAAAAGGVDGWWRVMRGASVSRWRDRCRWRRLR